MKPIEQMKKLVKSRLGGTPFIFLKLTITFVLLMIFFVAFDHGIQSTIMDTGLPVDEGMRDLMGVFWMASPFIVLLSILLFGSIWANMEGRV